MNTQNLIDTARALVASDRRLLAMDESNPTCHKRFAKLGIPQTVEARRAYREWLVSSPGLGAFLSGGQSAELASARLNAMNVRFKSRLPWALTFSFSRAIQQPALWNRAFGSCAASRPQYSTGPALEIWRGKEANVVAAQQALVHRARCNRAACQGEYRDALESTSH